MKMRVSGARTVRAFDSHARLGPNELVAQVCDATDGWKYDGISIGYPGAVGPDGPRSEPGNLGGGWTRFDFDKAFKRPVRIINDAAMQALGAYDGGRMLFLGLGTGVGSTLISDGVVVPLELGDLPYRAKGKSWSKYETLSKHLGREGLRRIGKRAWLRIVKEVSAALRDATAADYVMLGGGNAELVKRLPKNVRRGGNEDAFKGGFRLWDDRIRMHAREPRGSWLVLC